MDIAPWLLYFGAIAVFAALENSLVFQPSSATQSWAEPVDPRTRDIHFADTVGTKLHAWWIPPEHPNDGAFLIAHGNGGNVSHRGQLAADLRAVLGAGVLLFEYPGYGRSEGVPSEMGCYAAGAAAHAWLTNEAGIAASRIVLFGESLGGATAVDLAIHHDHRALVLVSTFTSLPAAAKYHYPWLPTHMLMNSRFDSLSKIGRCPRPVFIAHGTADEIVPYRHGEQLFAAANPPKEILAMTGQPHNVRLGDEFFQPLARFLKANAP